MRMKNMLAVAAAFAFCTVSFASLAANAGEEKTIDCTNASALGLGDEGNAVRRNIYNVWGNDVKDIDAETAVSEYITVTFTISGIGEDYQRKDADSSTKYDADGVNYIAFVGGSVVDTSRHSAADVGSDYITLHGDDTYTVTWNLGDLVSENINCLYLQTNIDFTDYVAEADKEAAEKAKDVSASGITLTIDSITTVQPDAESDTTESTTEADTTETEKSTTTEATTTTTDNKSTTTAKTTTTTTAKKDSSSASATTAAAAADTTETVENTPTGDSSAIALVASVLATAGAAALISKKKD